VGEPVKRWVDWLMRRLIKVGQRPLARDKLLCPFDVGYSVAPTLANCIWLRNNPNIIVDRGTVSSGMLNNGRKGALSAPDDGSHSVETLRGQLGDLFGVRATIR
jgi:hypothetical protein